MDKDQTNGVSNLLFSSDSEAVSKSPSINIADHDTPGLIPDDLGTEASSSLIEDSTVPFYKQKEIRIWLYVLGASLLIFVIILVLLTRETSLFKDDLAQVESETTEAVPQFYAQGSAFDINSIGSDNLDDLEDPSDAADDFDNIDPVLDDDALPGADEDPADEDDMSGLSLEDILNQSDSNPTAPPVNPGQNDLFGAADDVAPEDDIFGDAPGLDSNTDPAVMDSGEIEGEAGPAIWLSLLPVGLYSLIRRKFEK
jgi:hypothetical protein